MASPTCRDIVRRAVRKLSKVAAGMELNGDDAADAMEVLQALYLEMIGLGIFGSMYDYPVTAATFTALPQMRVVCNNEDGVIVTLPDLITQSMLNSSAYSSWCACNPDWDYGFCGNSSQPMPPRDGACIQIIDLFSETAETYIYESLAQRTDRWIRLDGLSLDSIAPLGTRYSEAVACILASRLAPEFATQASPEVTAAASRGMYALNHRYDGQRAPVRVENF